MIQQGQVFKLTAKGANGELLWAYRYRLEGRSSARPQVGGFASRGKHGRHCGRRSIGSVLGAAARSRLPSSSRSTWNCIKPNP